MAILNEWAVMGPNYPMLVLGVILVCTGVSMSFALMSSAEKFGRTLFGFAVALLFIFGGSWCVRNWDNPEYEIPTGKKYIEATFANGSPTAAILEKYDVIDVRNGNVYLMREKDGVKDEKRPKVTIYEEAKK